MTTTTEAKAPVGRLRVPRTWPSAPKLVRIANLAGSILISLRQSSRGMYHSERQLKLWLTEDGVQFTTGDIAHALVLLESKGHIQRAIVTPNVPRPGWLATAAERELGNDHVATPDAVEAVEDRRESDVGSAAREAVELVKIPKPDAVAVAILKTFDVPGRGFQGQSQPH